MSESSRGIAKRLPRARLGKRDSGEPPSEQAMRLLDQPLGEHETMTQLLGIYGTAAGARSIRWTPATDAQPAPARWVDPDAADPTPTRVTHVVTAGRRELGTLLLAPGAGDQAEDLLGELATFVRLVIRRQRATDQLAVARSEATRARLDLRDTRRQLTVVRDLERQRLVASLLDFAGAPLHAVRDTVGELEQAVIAGTSTPEDAERVVAALDQATERFRAVARGIYPVMLRDRGPADTLAQLALTLAGEVRFEGSLGKRAGWEVESGLYLASASAMTLLTEPDAAPVHVTFEHDPDRLTVTLVGSTPPTDVRAALAANSARIAAFGGELRIDDRPDEVMVTICLPEDLRYRAR